MAGSWLAIVAGVLVAALLHLDRFVAILLIFAAGFAFFIPVAVNRLPRGRRLRFAGTMALALSPVVCVAWAVTHHGQAVPALVVAFVLFVAPHTFTVVRTLRGSRRR